MAIDRAGNFTGYRVGGKKLGVQLGGKSGGALFGKNSANASNFFAANVTGNTGISVNPKQIAIKGIQDQIDRILGYRTDLTTAEKQKLADLQSKITSLEEQASTRSLTEDEIAERAELYFDSYRILGKDYKDVTNDEFVQLQTKALKALIRKKPVGADLVRFEFLNRVKDKLADQFAKTEKPSQYQYSQVTSVSKMIARLQPLRAISELSRAELREHDEIAIAINDHVGLELELTSDKKLKIERLQATISAIQAGGGSSVNSII